MLANGGRNVKFNKAEFFDMNSLSRNSASSVAAQRVRKRSTSLVGFLNIFQKMAHGE